MTTNNMTVDPGHASSSVDDCRLIMLRREPLAAEGASAGAPAMTAGQNGHEATLPFDVRRVYYLYDVPADSERGGHSHRRLSSLLVAVAGSVDVHIDDGVNSRVVHLDRPWKGLLITPGIWRTLDNFSAGSVMLVLASDLYDEDDYVREYDDFRLLTKCKR